MRRLLLFTFCLVVSLVSIALPVYSQTSPWHVGDVFVGIDNGRYIVYDSTNGYSASTLTVDSGGGQSGGCGFDSQFNFYGTNLTTQRVTELNADTGSLVQTISVGGTSPESLLFSASGNLYFASANAAVQQFDPALPPASDGSISYPGSATTLSFTSNTDWIDLARDQKTFYYTGDSTTLNKFTLGGATTTLASFSDPAYAVRLLPPLDGTDLLVANTSAITRISSGKATSYTLRQQKNLRFLAIDPDGVSFWAGDWATGLIFQLSLKNGSVIQSLDTGAKKSMGGICVKGEPRLNATPLHFTSTTLQQVADFGDPTSLNFHTYSITFAKVVNPITLVMSATEGVALSRFDEWFCDQAEFISGCTTPWTGTPTLKPVEYAHQQDFNSSFSLAAAQPRGVVYRVENPPPTTSYTGDILMYVSFNPPTVCPSGSTTNCYTPLSCLSTTVGQTNPRLFRDPSSSPPDDAAQNHNFAFDFTSFYVPHGNFLDPLMGSTKTTNDYVVADRCPSVPGGNAVFNSPLLKQKVKSGSVLPIKLTITDGSGNTVPDAVRNGNGINLSVTEDKTGNVEKTFAQPGSSFAFFTFNGQSYAGNLDTTGLPIGLNWICVTSVDTDLLNNTTGTTVEAGQFPGVCTEINIVK